MTTAGLVALAIVIGGAFSYAAASILQAVAARRSSGTVKTMGHPFYLAGIACDMLAWVGAMVALQSLAVYVVESVLAGSLALTVIGARIFLKSRLRPRDVAAIVVTLAALAVLAMSAGPQEDVPPSARLRLWLCAAAVAVVATGWGAAKAGAPGGVVAALAGLCLGGAALVGRALPVPSSGTVLDKALAIVTEPLTAALLIFAATGMMLYAHALQRGEVGPVTAVHWTFEVLTPSLVAVAFLGDTVRAGWEVPAAVAALVTVASAALLATAPATGMTHAGELTAAPSSALVAASRPRERIIWWGPPPIWRPPSRAQSALFTPRLVATGELTWTAAFAEPSWATELREKVATEREKARPWHDL
ncbi:hypothetical protein AB0M54_14180 [Actinoplanes sp. NPDC051470]|uniref:hypothetical protein n=1 Tax=unclassified Actinoplanes TaxID=2626549 RepID=UPI0034454CC6